MKNRTRAALGIVGVLIIISQFTPYYIDKQIAIILIGSGLIMMTLDVLTRLLDERDKKRKAKKPVKTKKECVFLDKYQI